jgi:hypothetical protein
MRPLKTLKLVSGIPASRLSIYAFLLKMNFFFPSYDHSPSSHLAPGTVTKPLQEEAKKEEMPIKDNEKPVDVEIQKPLPTDLPVLNEVPVFKGLPLIEHD